MERKILDTKDIAEITKKETIRYFMRIVEQEPEDHDDFFDIILENDYFKVKIDLIRLLKLLKPLITDKGTNIRMLENEIFYSEDLAFVDLTKGKEVVKNSGDLYIRTFFTPIHEEETKKNIITLYTNLFKVKLDPENPIHLTFMKKMIDMRSSPILKDKKGNTETDIKTFLEILKLTFNMKSKFKFDTIVEGGNAYNFKKMIKSEAPSLSREVSGASVMSTASSIRDEKSTFFMSVEKLNPKKYDFYGENINYFTYLLLRTTEQGLIVYDEWYAEFVDSHYFSNNYFVLWDNFKDMLDKYVFDSFLEDLEEMIEQDPDEKDPDVINLSFQTFIPKKQIEDIKNGNILFLTKEVCLTLNLENDIEFLEELPLIYPKDIYDTKNRVKDYKVFMKSLYLLDDEYESDSDLSHDGDDKDFTKKEVKMYNKFFDFIKGNYKKLEKQYPVTKSEKRLKNMRDEIVEKLIELYGVVSKEFIKYKKDEGELLREITMRFILNIDGGFTNKGLLDYALYDIKPENLVNIRSNTKKLLFDYFDFVRSNYEVFLEEFPQLKIDDDEFIEKLISIYKVGNKKFKDFIKSKKPLIVDLTEYILNNPKETNKKVFGNLDEDLFDDAL